MTAPLRQCGAAGRALSSVLLWFRARDRAQIRPGPIPLEPFAKRVDGVHTMLPAPGRWGTHFGRCASGCDAFSSSCLRRRC